MLTVNKTEEQTTKNIVTHKPFWASYNFLQILYALYGNVIMIIFFLTLTSPLVQGVLCSKPLGCSKVNSAFHPSEVDKISTKNFWELSGKK